MDHGNTESRTTAVLLGLLLIFACAGMVRAQTTSFTYQGRLTDGGTPATGSYDLQFALWDSNSGGTQIGATQTVNAVAVSGGIFTVTLDFGVSAFPGANRFLEISVRPAGGGSFTILSPRQQISSTPYAIRTLSATSADTATTALTATNATQLGGVAASQYVQTNDSRLTDSRSPTAGSSNYIQNTTTPQSSSNFNISGDGTAAGTLNGNVVNATTQYNLGGQRILSNAGNGNLFAGVLSGPLNTSGAQNVFVGPSAGRSNTTGSGNSFFGFNAGFSNVGDNSGNGTGNSFFGSRAGNNNTGSLNSFFGIGAGLLNGTDSYNSFFGANAGSSNAGSYNNFFGVNAGNSNAGSLNNFVGYQAGLFHTTGDRNNFFGAGAGYGDSNGSTGSGNNFFGEAVGINFTAGNGNSVFGDGAGFHITTASENSFFGDSAGSFNTTGSFNTFIGPFAGNPSFGSQVSHSTAIGDNALVGCSHCMVLGDPSDSSIRVGIGTSLPAGGKLVVESSSTAISGRSTCNFCAGVYGENAAIGGSAVRGNGTSFFSGDTHPLSSALGKGVAIGFNGGAAGGYVFGYDYGTSTPQQLYLNHLGGNVGIGTSSPDRTLTVNGRARIGNIPGSGGTEVGSVCFDPPGNLLNCGLSSLRYKTNIEPFAGGLDIVRRLRPITFNWKESGLPDVGLGAEDVAKVAPAFIFANGKGEISGVKYDRLNILLINAIKEQQAQIENLRAQNAALSARLLGVEKALRKKAGSFRRQR